MKVFLLVVFIAFLATAVTAWTKEDHEIFDLVSAIENAEGQGTTFYSWLGVPSTAKSSEIGKAYRKKSMMMHPDKNPGVKGIQERFARLGVIAKILRDKESRTRYDFFYKNGVPTWRGTGYYYSRFRPGLGSVAVFLVLLTSGLQYVVQRMNYKRDLERIRFIMSEARNAAWGSKVTPGEGQRKVKVNLGGKTYTDGNAANGRWIDLVVEGSNVYVTDDNGDMEPLDESTATAPSVTGTWFLALLVSQIRRVTSKSSEHSAPADRVTSEDDDTDTGSETPASGTSTPNSSLRNGKAGKASATTMAGGKRRKAVKKR